MALTPTAAAARMYRYVDAAGDVHFTNVSPWWRSSSGRQGRVRPAANVDTYDELIVAAGVYYSLPPALLKAVVAVESNFVTGAVSSAGAVGLMQLVPATALEMAVVDSFDPADNIYGGARYLRIQINRFAGDLRLSLAAYNAGPAAVERAGDVPAYPETRDYVRRVLILYRYYSDNWRMASP